METYLREEKIMNNVEQKTVQCPKCGSDNVVSSTSTRLKRYHLLDWDCLGCEKTWITGWDINIEPSPDVLEHMEEYEDEIKAYIDKYKDEDAEHSIGATTDDSFSVFE